MINFVYLIVSIVILASLHMVAPDHWLPLTAISIKRKLNATNSAFIASGIGLAHSILSLVLSFAIILFGMYFFGPGSFKNIAIVIIAIVCIYMFSNTMIESRRTNRIEDTALTVSVLPDPAILPFIVTAGFYGYTGLFYASITFVVVSAASLAFISYSANIGLISRLRDLKPVTIDRVVIIILIVTAIYIYFLG
jgi:hypothetical protein